MSKLLFILSLIGFTFAEVDCIGIEDGNTICLGFDAVDQNAGSFDITYNSLHPISGFQFNLSEIEILSGESALGSVYTIQSSGFVMAFLESMYLPPSENGILATIYFTSGPEVTTCLSNTILAGGGGLSFEIDLPECLTIPEADTDCTGEYGGDAVVDECGACEGSEFNCNEAGACSCSGCMDEASCNFNEMALVNDGTCWEPSEYCSCADGSGAVADCNDVCNGPSALDECGECDGNGWDLCDDNENGTSNYEEWGYGAYDLNISDVPDDQGGRVYITFHKSFYDTDTLRSTEGYNIERLDNGEWIQLQSIYAYGLDTYQTIAETLQDSSTTTDGLTEFRIVAAMEEGNYVSLDDENGFGYSVDNIHPATPSLMSAEHEGDDITINWQYELEEDFNYHEITGLWNTTYSTENTLDYELSATNDEHRIQSVDINDNQSEESQSLLSRKLDAGANLISFNVLPEDVTVSNVLSSLDCNVVGVITEAGACSQIACGTWVGSQCSISAYRGYWVIMTEDDILLIVGYPTDRNEPYPLSLNAGANLIGYPYRYATSTSNALPDDIEDSVVGVITEGGACSQINPGQWEGSQCSFIGGKGYWIILYEDVSLTFINGCDEPECVSLSRKSQNLSTIPDGYDYRQSTTQAFYFLEEISGINNGDWILAYNGDAVVGSRQWQGSIIDVPAMGSDGNEYSDGYMEAGGTPQFKLLSGGKLINLEGEVPAWSDNGLFMVSSLTQAIVPVVYSLSQAYPNPFNPTTTLSFAIPIDSEVSLSIYNLQGREVSTLIDANMEAGYHSVVWDADSYASGVYFVKMVAGKYISTQKLMLVK